VFARAALVAIAGHHDPYVGVLAQPRGLALEHRAGLRRQVEAIVTKEDAVADGDAEVFERARNNAARLLAWRGGRDRRGRRLGTAGAAGDRSHRCEGDYTVAH